MSEHMPDRPRDEFRDPFEEAAEEEFHRVRDKPLHEGPSGNGSLGGATPSPPAKEGERFGRDGSPVAEAPDDPEADGTTVHRPHTPIAGTPPDDPMIYRDASEKQLQSARAAAPNEEPVGPTDPVVSEPVLDDRTAADAAINDPTGERFRTGAFANDAGWLQPGPRNVQLCYWLNLASFVAFPLVLATIWMSIANRRKVNAEVATHYTYAMRTVFLGVLYALLASIFGGENGLVLLLVVGWYIWRNLRGLTLIGVGQPVPRPLSWL